MMNLKRYFFLILFVTLLSCNWSEKGRSVGEAEHHANRWPLSSYNFGGMQEMTVKEQIRLLHASGYQGLILRMATPQNFEQFPEFIEEANKLDDFKINAVFVRYNFNDADELKEHWKEVVDRISGLDAQLWVIFGKKESGIDDQFIFSKLTEINTYAFAKGVEVILYPHSSCYFESSEEALPIIEEINHDNLKLAFHLYHEIRAKNGHRIGDVFQNVEHRLGALTLAGSDSVADYRSPLARDTSTIKLLGKGTFDMQGFVSLLKEKEYLGYVGVMNFSIKEAPEKYLKESYDIWQSYLQ